MDRSAQFALLRHLQALADLMDSRFTLFGVSFGLDSVFGLVPGLGDIIGGLVSLYIVWQAYRLGVPEHILSAMLFTIVIDVTVGSVPVAGDLFDIFYKVNRRNIRRIEAWLRAERS